MKKVSDYGCLSWRVIPKVPKIVLRIFLKANPTIVLCKKQLLRYLFYIQLSNFENIRLLNKPYENEVTLTGQNAPLKCCQLLGLLTQLKREIDL